MSSQLDLSVIIDEVLVAIDEAIYAIHKKDYNSFVLLIGRADMIPGLKTHQGTDCVIDYQLDSIYDETRTNFYLRYLRRNYNKKGFSYQGDNGIDDMHIELMIYTHLWDSTYFLKSLMRIASIISGNGYLWNPEIDWMGRDDFMKKRIINPLTSNGLKLGSLIERCYDSSVRNAFAHSLYTIDAERKTITIRPRKGMKTLSFDEFQSLFLYSVTLMNKMQNAIETNHDMAAHHNTALTNEFTTPDGVNVQVFAKMVQRGDRKIPEFNLARIKGE